MMFKKILISSASVIGSGAIAAGLSLPLSLTTSYSQSATVEVDDNDDTNLDNNNIPEEPVVPDDDNEPQEDDSNILYVANYDTFVTGWDDRKINYDVAHDDATLNAYLTGIFLLNGVSCHLENEASYENTTLDYVYNSANYNNKTFEITATADDGYSFNDLTNVVGDTKTILVAISTDDIDSTKYTANVPETDTYTALITYEQVSNSEMLNNYLKTEFNSNGLTNNLLNYSKYRDINLSYVENSAIYDENQFYLQAYPLDGYAWSDGTNGVKQVLVTLSKLDKNLWDSSIGNSLTYTKAITTYTVDDLEESLVGLFSDETNLEYLISDKSISNVDIEYVTGSASLTNQNFSLNVTPKNNHAWSDGATNTKTFTVTLTNLDIRSLASVPTRFSLNAAATFKSEYEVANIDNISWVTMRTIGYNSLEQFYKYIEYVGPNANKRSGYVTIAKSDDNTTKRNRVYITPILVKPKSGYTWSDGSTYQKSVYIYYFYTFMSFDYTVTKQNDVYTFATEVSNGTINRWISNFIYAPSESERYNTSKVTEKVYEDLYSTLSQIYWVSSEIQFTWIFKGSNWENDITFGQFMFTIAPKDDLTKTKTITGYLFTASSSQLNFINSYFW